MKKSVPAEVYVGDKQISSAEIFYDSNSKYRKPGHTHLFCRCCGRIWGSIIVNAVYQTSHHTLYKPCEEHGGGLFIKEGAVQDWFSVKWGAGVYEHDFCVIYDKWLEGNVEPAKFDDGSVEGDWSCGLHVGDCKEPLKMLEEDRAFRKRG